MKRSSVFKRSLSFLVFFGVCAVLFLAGTLFYLARNLPSVEEITNRQVSQSTKIYDRDGTTLLYEISSGEKRTVVPFDQIPRVLKDSTIVTEDEKFYEEPAFDWRAIVRALLANLTNRQIVQGGSTITQQLAKNAFLTPERTLSRKVRELILATQLNRNYSKDQILSFYLNEIPYGPTAYGVESASWAFFNKSVRDINLAEGALLAALPKAPTYYSPWGSHVSELLSRQRFILEKLFRLGKITKNDLDDALKFKISFAPQSRGLRAPHFTIAVQDYLIQKYGEDLVRRGGLRVLTTLNWKLQELAERVVADGAERNEKLYKGKNAALVAEDARTGQILALVGSRDYFDTKNDGNFSVATQGLRQPGSALKPFVYLVAFQKGFTPDTVVFDVPTEFAANNPSCPPAPSFENENKRCFHPENFDGQFRGPVSLRNALAQSINIPAVKVLYLAGLRTTVETAYRLGLTTLTNPDLYGLSLVLGGGAVKLIDLVGAYSVLAQEGMKRPQTMVLEVRDSRGKILESYRDESERVVDPQPVRVVNDILSDDVARSGLFQGSLSLTVFPDRDVALKTGTSNDYRDAWTVGYTPSLVVGVWAGNNDNAPMQRHGSSLLAAVPIWNSFMVEALKDGSSETFNRPDPALPKKPILGGDYLAGRQIHSILYYVNRQDPLGAPPRTPGDDPQFTNWETQVLAWAEKNVPDFKTYNQLSGPAPESPVGTNYNALSVRIEAPQRGEFIDGKISLLASVVGQNQLSKIRIYLNGQLAEEFDGESKKTYNLAWSFFPKNPQPQNLLEVEAVDEQGLKSRDSVIIYD